MVRVRRRSVSSCVPVLLQQSSSTTCALRSIYYHFFYIAQCARRLDPKTSTVRFHLRPKGMAIAAASHNDAIASLPADVGHDLVRTLGIISMPKKM